MRSSNELTLEERAGASKGAVETAVLLRKIGNSLRANDGGSIDRAEWRDLVDKRAEYKKLLDEFLANGVDASTMIEDRQEKVGDALSGAIERIDRELDKRTEAGDRGPRNLRSGRMAAETANAGERAANWRDTPGLSFRNVQTGATIRGVRGDESFAAVYGDRGRRSAGRFGDLAASMVRGRAVSPEIEEEFRAMSLSGAAGAVPEPMAMKFIDLARAEAVVFKAGAVTVPMDGSTLKLAKITADAGAAWKAENSGWTAADPTIGSILLTAHVLGGVIVLSEEVAMDSPNIGEIIEASIRGDMALKLDTAALVGSGVSPEPQGIYGASDVQTQVVGGTPTGYGFFSQMVQKVRNSNHSPNAAIWNPRDLGTLDRLVDTTNQPLRPPKSFEEVQHFSTNAIPKTYENGASPNDGSICIVGKFNELVFAPRMDVRLLASRESHDGSGSALAKFQIHIQYAVRADFGIFRGAAFCVGTGIND